MPGVIIYKTKESYYGFIFPDRCSYRTAKDNIRGNKDEILWKKGNVGAQQAENAKGTIDCLVKRLKNGEKVDKVYLANALEGFFQCDGEM